MAPSASVATTATQSLSKAKRPPGIQTNGINSSTSSPSPSMSAGRLPNSAKPPNSAISNGVLNSAAVRSANRAKRDPPGPLLGRGQRNGSAGLRSAGLAGDAAISQIAEPLPYVLSDEYILKKHRHKSPSVIVHLHPTHFRFDEQEGSFSYKSPMRIFLDHLKTRTVPHELMEYLQEVPFYDGCLIVQVHDHKTTAPPQSATRPPTNVGKTIPFSVHNYNYCITPSSYVPYPTETNAPGKKQVSDGDADDKSKTAEQKDKENMPAPAFPGDRQGAKATTQPRKPKVHTVVLKPTPLSAHFDLAVKAAETLGGGDGRRGSVAETIPPTPTTSAIVPPTPQSSSMAPPAKRQKKNKPELNSNNIYDAEAQITLATTALLDLEPVNSAAECAALLKAQAHPMYSEKPPSPKTRKRTVAEMAADEALAAEQERYLLILDERLSSNATNAQGGGNPTDGDGQAGGASFEPRFERFKTLENIKNQHEENKRLEKQRLLENERKAQQERERERLRIESEKRDQEKMQQQRAAQESHRRRLAQQAQAQGLQNMQAMPPQIQNQHAHPQSNNMMQNTVQGQTQRFHTQQVSQAPVSSPVVRNGTPQSHSSPIVGNMGNVPMQHSTSSMGGSPPRPGSVVHQNHPPMGAPMVPQRSQQSHTGTPRMPSATPHMQPTPLNRTMTQTPRMSQGSPVQVSMAQTQAPMMMHNGQITMNNPQLMMQHQQQQAAQAQRLALLRQQQTAQIAANMANSGQPIPDQVRMAQARMLAQQHQQQQQQQQQQQAGGMPMSAANPQLAQQYAAQMAVMGQQGLQHANMTQQFANGGRPMNMQQLQALQVRQAQAHAAAAAAQAQAQAIQGMQQQPIPAQQLLANQIRHQATIFYRERLPAFQAQHPSGIPPEADRAFRAQCQTDAQQAVTNIRRAQFARQQQQQLMAQQGMNMQNMGMQNGMQM